MKKPILLAAVLLGSACQSEADIGLVVLSESETGRLAAVLESRAPCAPPPMTRAQASAIAEESGTDQFAWACSMLGPWSKTWQMGLAGSDSAETASVRMSKEITATSAYVGSMKSVWQPEEFPRAEASLGLLAKSAPEGMSDALVFLGAPDGRYLEVVALSESAGQEDIEAARKACRDIALACRLGAIVTDGTIYPAFVRP